jgi:hypothetical protein
MPKYCGFAKKLICLLSTETYATYIEWHSNGNYFAIKNKAAFISDVLPQLFGHNEFQFFIRQLYNYGFKVAKHEYIFDGGVLPYYYHPCLTRNQIVNAPIHRLLECLPTRSKWFEAGDKTSGSKKRNISDIATDLALEEPDPVQNQIFELRNDNDTLKKRIDALQNEKLALFASTSEQLIQQSKLIQEEVTTTTKSSVRRHLAQFLGACLCDEIVAEIFADVDRNKLV